MAQHQKIHRAPVALNCVDALCSEVTFHKHLQHLLVQLVSYLGIGTLQLSPNGSLFYQFPCFFSALVSQKSFPVIPPFLRDAVEREKWNGSTCSWACYLRYLQPLRMISCKRQVNLFSNEDLEIYRENSRAEEGRGTENCKSDSRDNKCLRGESTHKGLILMRKPLKKRRVWTTRWILLISRPPRLAINASPCF